jgi:hypothetical protein
MDMFSINLTPQEISVLRQSLDTITLSGKDAKFIASLQIKLEQELGEILKQVNTPPVKSGKTTK